jgi:hypothetical protein
VHHHWLIECHGLLSKERAEEGPKLMQTDSVTRMDSLGRGYDISHHHALLGQATIPVQPINALGRPQRVACAVIARMRHCTKQRVSVTLARQPDRRQSGLCIPTITTDAVFLLRSRGKAQICRPHSLLSPPPSSPFSTPSSFSFVGLACSLWPVQYKATPMTGLLIKMPYGVFST